MRRNVVNPCDEIAMLFAAGVRGVRDFESWQLELVAAAEVLVGF